MEMTTGRVVTQVTIENLGDIVEVERGSRSSGDIRRVTVNDALVDTGATTLALPTRLISQLGLTRVYTKQAKSTRGVGPVSVYEAVRLTIERRFCSVDVMEAPDDVPVLVGQIPLEMLDLVVDLQGRRLIGNPAHDGEHILELFWASSQNDCSAAVPAAQYARRDMFCRRDACTTNTQRVF